MKKEYRIHNIYLIIYLLLVALWLVSILFKAYRTDGDQILFHDGDYYDCTEKFDRGMGENEEWFAVYFN